MDESEGKSLYEILGVEKDASQADIKKAYMKLALKLHPDKNPNDEVAKERFQTLQRVYAVLKDPERRKVYDDTGSLEDSEELAGEKFEDLYQYYRSMFKTVTEDDIVEFENEYRGSAEEEADLLRLYEKFKGNMPVVFEWQLCSRPDRDSHRFADTIENSIGAGKVKKHSAFVKWAKKVRETPAPRDPLKPIKPMKQGSQDLVAMIRGKNKAKHDDLVALLEEKYGAPARQKTGKQKASKQAKEEGRPEERRRKRKAGSTTGNR
uniref:DnaJ homolog subfamily C member 9 n=1 Tax=Tetraselmis sp. GSL018 TaxID=582737 RepID=A0A061QXB2_9CHLO